MLKRLRPYAQIKPRGAGSNSLRVEFSKVPPELSREAQELQSHCAKCGAIIHPFRARVKQVTDDTRPWFDPSATSFYYGGSCPADVKSGCHKGNAITAHMKLVAALMRET